MTPHPHAEPAAAFLRPRHLLRGHGSGILLAAALALIRPAGSAAASPAIVNGSFDEAVPRNGSGGGWSTEHVDGAGGWYPSHGLPAPCYRLNDAGSASSDPRIWQTVEGFEPGQVYTLRGDYALGVPYGNPANSFEVRVDGVAVLSLGPAPEHGAGSGVFAPFQVSFAATAASHVIELAAEANGSDHDYYIDNIAIEGFTPTAGASWSSVKARYR